MKRFYPSAVLGLLLCVGLPASSAPPAADDKPTFIAADGPDVLKGLKDVGVAVERFPQDFLTPALTMDAVKTDVELKLKQNGLHVLPVAEAQTARVPVLSINLNGFKAINGLFVYNINLFLKEDVAPTRTKSLVVTGAVVWQREFVGATGELNLPAVRTDIKEDIDTFLNDYRAANQIKP
ncbi:MAG: hypothetical protein JWL77_5688 [Chthonomonadaceae bacterium]|nr:hypothetical protein [Chthonomonadaceae bacterium]